MEISRYLDVEIYERMRMKKISQDSKIRMRVIYVLNFKYYPVNQDGKEYSLYLFCSNIQGYNPPIVS